MPNIGFWAVAGGAGGAAGAYELISTTVLGTTQATVTFTNGAWSTYKHLQIRTTMKNSASNLDVIVRLNGDTAGNYSWHNLQGYNGSVTSGATTSATGMTMGISAVSTDANMFGAAVVDLLDFSSTTKNTTLRSLTGSVGSATKLLALRSGAWYNTAAVSSISFTASAGSFAANSRFSIYGVKA